MLIPAHAEVLTVTFDKELFTINDEFTISGTVSDTSRTDIIMTIKGASTKIPVMNAIYRDDGTYTFTPRDANDIFKREGTYIVTVYTGSQAPESGMMLKVQRDGKKIMLVPDFVLKLEKIGNKQVKETEKLSFIARITDPEITQTRFSLQGQPAGATIDSKTGVFSWTPTSSQIGGHAFDVIVDAETLQDIEKIVVTVSEKQDTVIDTDITPATTPKLPSTPKDLGIASFVDPSVDPQSYVDRYNTEDAYKQWFDSNYPQYDSIYQAVGLEGSQVGQPPPPIAPFVDTSVDPQSYVDRYNTEDTYKQWFDSNYPQYDSIYQAVGLEEPLTVPAPFVDASEDPQSYVDRYNTEDTYKQWFDSNYPQYDSIYQAVGLTEPSSQADAGTQTQESGLCGPGTDLIDGVCVIVDASKGSGNEGGGCLIATAAYGSEMSSQVQLLREVRDIQLLNTESGTAFMAGFNQAYYSFSPAIADMQRENPMLKEIIRTSITPMLWSLAIMSHADTEAEVMVYGISVILINVAAYIAVPAAITIKVASHIKHKIHRPQDMYKKVN